LFALLLVVLSHLVDEGRLIHTVALNLEFLLPGQAPAITEQIAAFLEHRHVVGGIGIAALLFFSSIAFSILEDAMAMIFHHRAPKPRHPLLSAVIPYAFMMALGAGLLLVTLITGALEGLGQTSVHILGHAWSLARLSRTLLYVLGMAGSALMLTALYMVLPARRVTFRRAFIGGVAATMLWEIVRHVLVWYFRTLSLVNVVYGSLATAVIVLLTLEVAALILLLGAQVIAELERASDHAGAATRPRSRGLRHDPDPTHDLRRAS
jgi:YihY family inner membrane protein